MRDLARVRVLIDDLQSLLDVARSELSAESRARADMAAILYGRAGEIQRERGGKAGQMDSEMRSIADKFRNGAL